MSDNNKVVLSEAFVGVLASLAAAISLLERGGKKGAPSDRMFKQMLLDYQAALENGREVYEALCAALATPEPVDAGTAGDPAYEAHCYREGLAEAVRLARNTGMKVAAIVGASAGGSEARFCDCERGHNGTGIAGRKCDCAPDARDLGAVAGWRCINTAPEDQHVLLATSGGFVGEAIMLRDEDTGDQKWSWALGPVHQNHLPLGWQYLPTAISKPVQPDHRSGGFDGPTGAD